MKYQAENKPKKCPLCGAIVYGYVCTNFVFSRKRRGGKLNHEEM